MKLNAKNLWTSSACAVVDALRSGEISVQATYESLFARIKSVDELVNALPTIAPFDQWQKKSNSKDQQQDSVLCGLPVSIKDLTDVAGLRTTYGCAIYGDHIPEKSDQLVALIEQRGGMIYAKTNTPEFGTGGITFNDVFGLTRSPRNTAFASGGSSGGAAAALASGCAWLSLGSDMAGSLRTPAAFCGVTSLRPSPGRIRSDSADLPYAVLGQQGPMARNIEDLGLFADAMFAEPQGSYRDAANHPEMPRRVAVSRDLGVTRIDESVVNAFDQYVETLRQADIEVIEASPDFSDVHQVFDVLRANEYAIGLESLLNDHPGVMKPEVEWNIRAGLELSSAQIRQATKRQGRVVQAATEFMQDVDLLICPATSVSSVDAELRYPGSNGEVPIEEYYRWLAIAYTTTVASLPVITLPCSLGTDGMPFAVQLVGKLWGESKLLQHASALEKHNSWCSAPIDPLVNH